MTNIVATIGTRPGMGVVQGSAVLTLPDRDYRCLCTWVPASSDKRGNATFRLKYRNAACPASITWHNSIMRTDNDDDLG